MNQTNIFKVFKQDIIPDDSDYLWCDRRLRDLKPSWKDFTENRVAISQYHLNHVIENLSNHHLCFLLGDKDTGKTWLTYSLGYHLVNNDKMTRYVVIDDDFNAQDAWDEIVNQELKGKNKLEVFFIIEDCHLKPLESEEFLQLILDEGEENLRFLFTMRKTGKYILENIETEDPFHYIGSKKNIIVTLEKNEVSQEHVKNIIKKFIQEKNIKYEITENELELIVEKWSIDLYHVWLRLASWNYDIGQRILDITDDQVYESIWQDRYEIKLSMTNRKDILMPISAISQFEHLKFPEILLRKRGIDEETLKELKDEGIINVYGVKLDLLSIPEGLAEIILTTAFKKDPSVKQKYISIENYVFQILKDLLIIDTLLVKLVFVIIYKMKGTYKNDLGRLSIKNLINDKNIWDIIKNNVKDSNLYEILYLIDCILWADNRTKINESEKALEIREIFLFFNYKPLQTYLKNSSAGSLGNHIVRLSRIVNIQRFFQVFTVEDFVNIIKKSSFNSIYRLIYKLIGQPSKSNYDIHGIKYRYQKSLSAAKKLVTALSMINLSKFISDKNSSLYRLGGIIGNAIQIDQDETKTLLDNLSKVDLSNLFDKDYHLSKEKELTKVKIVNYFLTKRLLLFPKARIKIIRKINRNVWENLLKSDSCLDNFWLLWNIYVSAPDIAKSIVDSNFGNRLLKQYNKHKDKNWYLAFLGLLHLFDYPIQKIKIELDLLVIKQQFNNIKDQPTLFVLSLVALKIKMNPEQFKQIKEILDKEYIDFISTAPDIQIRKILMNLIKRVF